MRFFVRQFLYCLLFIATPTISSEIILVKTSDIPAINQIIDGLRPICSASSIQLFDMKGDLNQGQKIAEEVRKLVTNAPKKIVISLGLPATRLISKKISDSPIFFAMVNNPDQQNLAQMNIRGIASNIIIDDYLKLLLKILPNVKRIGIIYDQKKVGDILIAFKESFHRYELELVARSVATHKEVPKTLREIAQVIDALIILPDSTVINRFSLEYVITTAFENNLPTIGYTEELVERGMLLGISPNYVALGQQLGKMICQNTNSDSDNQQSFAKPGKTHLSINLKTANRINVALPEDITLYMNSIYQ